MNMLLDPFTLLLLAIAVVVIWKLRSVLGTRTGNERPPIDPFARSGKAQAPAAEPANSNVLRLPKESGDTAPVANNAEPPPPVWTGYAPEGSELAREIVKLSQADSGFTPKTFLEGAKLAYEMIVDGFAKGDKSALKQLLSREVYDGFSAAIDTRQANGQKIEQRFVGIDKADFDQIELSGNRAQVTVKFVSEMISATLAKDGTVVEGDTKQIRSVTDVWTFERDVNSRDPNWKLAATQAPA
jgi:predicted lipid-binding transport protein (Tim44 family)